MPGSDQIPPRREFKYLIDRAQLPALRGAIAPYCERDQHAGADGAYPLRSLYFDAPDLRLYHANEREAGTRFKARIRFYPEAERSPVFAEIKFRDGDVIRKTRTRFPVDDWTRALRPGGGVGLDPFVVRVHRHDLRPVVLVEYRREAWMSLIDEYARVSIDSCIQCQAVDSLDLHGDPARWRAIDHPLAASTAASPLVVELKWADYAPSWMVALVQQLDLLRFSFSKYCYAMRSLAEDHYVDLREAQSVWG